MSRAIRGIHHVTAIATDPQRNVDFYAGALGLRLVKRTVNFDDPGTYHFYFGDAAGRPGSILTFFPWPLARRGSRGTGQVTATALSVPAGSLGWWRDRLRGMGVVMGDVSGGDAAQGEAEGRFGDEVLTLLDPDGLLLELVADEASTEVEPWTGGAVPERHAVRGLHSVTLRLADAGETAELLAALGWHGEAEAGPRQRWVADGSQPGARVDLVTDPRGGAGQVAAGTVHHVAFRAADDPDQAAWRDDLFARGLRPTPVLDRQYFHSIYFREPGGVLFEIATDPPGFTLDETPAALGTALKLPPWLETQRQRIEEALPTIDTAPAASGAA